jgi:UDP-glucuronate 4-epimerase
MPSAGSKSPVLVTGAAGFIGMHVSRELLARGEAVVGIDNLNDYYDPQLKRDRIAQLQPLAGFRFEQADIVEPARIAKAIADHGIRRVIHLAAQAGVRHSLRDPLAYIQANIVGFANVLEACRHAQVEHLVYASSSSVYGSNNKVPFSESDRADEPASLYAATKKSNELLAHSYSHLFALPATGLRFFTVYGPWGRPDMAYYSFTKAILAGGTIQVFNEGRMERDFTYVDDVAEAVARVLDTPPAADAKLPAPHRVYNVGNHQPVALLDFVATLESVLGRQAVREFRPMQPGDMVRTCADIAALDAAVGFHPATPLRKGLAEFAAWYRDYHRV